MIPKDRPRPAPRRLPNRETGPIPCPESPICRPTCRSPRAIVDAVRARRGGTLLNLDRQLLHSPPLAMGWNTMLGAVRRDLSLSPRLRELAMCLVAVLNRAEYEFVQHAPLFVAAGGTPAQVEALRDPGFGAASMRPVSTRPSARRSALTIEMTRSVQVADDTFEAVRRALPDARQVIELVAVIAAYNMVSRFLVALHVEPE